MSKCSKKQRQKANHFGFKAEACAVELLKSRRCEILAQRYKCPLGEVDIIAKQNEAFVFVEVKARQTLSEALDALTERQQHRIMRAAQNWLAETNHATIDPDMRFDVIVVDDKKNLQHIKNAFEVTRIDELNENR